MLCFHHLWDSRAAGVRSKHLHQADGQEGEGQSPVDVHEVVHDVGAWTLPRVTPSGQKKKHNQ